jgi:Fe-coproporphyrin III synthase
MKKSNKNHIKDVVIAVTEKCNARCRMCNIWKKDDTKNELKSSDFLYLPKNLTNINISGGEPFLRSDLPEIVENIKKRCKSAGIIISTNGFATKSIVNTMKSLIEIDSNIGVVVSVDGVGENHDKIRGVLGGFKQLLNTVRELKSMGVKVKIAFTIADYNYTDLRNVYNLSLDSEIEMSLALVHSSENYFNIENDVMCKDDIRKSLDWLMRKELSSNNPKKWLRAYFTHGLKVFLDTGMRILPDYSGEGSAFISSNGDIYPSDVNNNKIGKLDSKNGFFVDDRKKKDKVSSWMICTARVAIRKHFIKAGQWILKNKIKNFFYDRSDLFYYTVGIVFMSLNKVRYFVLGYHNPRPIAKRDIDRNVSYSKSVMANFLKYLRLTNSVDFSFYGKDCLEIGPGSDFGTGLVAMSKGARSYTGVDRFNLLNFNGDFYDALYKSLSYSEQERVMNLIPTIKKLIFANNKGELDIPNFRYINSAFEDIGERIDMKYDVIFSQAVLEHTYNSNKVFGEMFDSLKEEGVMIHEIDFATHTSFLRDWDPLNILRFSEPVYNGLKFQGSPNRLRMSDYKKFAHNAGFKDIKIYPINELSRNSAEKFRESLKNKYKDYKISDLKMLSAVLIARK